MTEEQLMEKWRKYVSTYKLDLTASAESYINGEIEPLENAGILSTQKKYAPYFSDIVKELDTENAPLAKRMLEVLIQVRRDKMIERYTWENDVKICVKLGIPFQMLLQKSFFTFGSNFDAVDIRLLSEILLQNYESDIISYTEMLLSDKVDNLISTRKSDKSIYLLLQLAVSLLKRDMHKHKQYMPVLIKCCEQLSGDYIAMILYQSYTMDEALLRRLRELVMQEASTAKFLYYRCTQGEKFLTLLKELGLPADPYYSVLAIDNNIGNKKSKLFIQLYQEDPETFMRVYERIVAFNRPTDAINSLNLLAIMRKAGNGEQQLKEARLHYVSYLNPLSSYLKGDQNVMKLIRNTSLSSTELYDAIQFQRSIHHGFAEELISPFCILYDYDSEAKRMIDTMVQSAVANEDIHALSSLLKYFLTQRQDWLGEDMEKSVQLLLDNGLQRQSLYGAYCLGCVDWYLRQDHVLTKQIMKSFVIGYEKEAAAYFEDHYLKNNIDQTIVWMEFIYGEKLVDSFDPLFGLIHNKSKKIRNVCERLFSVNEEGTRAKLEVLAPKLKGESAQMVRRVIKQWDNERKFGKDFQFSHNQLVEEFVQDNYIEEDEKLIKWIHDEMLGDVRYRDLSLHASSKVLKYVLLEYMSLSDPYRVQACDKVMEMLHPRDIEQTLELIYQLWIDEGADTKKKNILIPYCLYGSDSQIIKLKRQIEQWAEGARGALGAFAVNAIALNGGSVALMMVDGMAAKFPHAQVKKAAKKAFEYAARVLEIPEDELSDRIVPTLGFNQQGEKILDYGSRTFTVHLMPSFELSIVDNDKGKTIKSLPKPAAGDDLVLAEVAKKELSELKKQIKTVVQTQTSRLEKVLMNGRTWSADRWTSLFVHNPILHRFATGLIWGAYEEGELVQSFRYMEDGTLNTVDEEEYSLSPRSQITLVHPVDLDTETIEQWKEQLEDYEIIQPIEQLTQPVIELEDSDLDGKIVTKFKDRSVTAGKLQGMAKKNNMIRGGVWDGGSYTCYHLQDKYLQVAVQINFEYMYMGQDHSEDVPLESIIFYRITENDEPEDEVKDHLILHPNTISQRFVSSMISMMQQIVG